MSAQVDDLPASCALIAMCACYQLGRHGVDCKPLAIVYQRKPVQRHIVTVIQFEGRMRVYDYRGCVTLPKTFTTKTKPIQIAKAWASRAGFSEKVLDSDWY